jgi:hypothetical protein
MSRQITVTLLLILAFFADVLSIQQTFRFWQNNTISNDGVSFLLLLLTQIVVAVALLSCGVFVFYKSFSKKDEKTAYKLSSGRKKTGNLSGNDRLQMTNDK